MSSSNIQTSSSNFSVSSSSAMAATSTTAQCRTRRAGFSSLPNSIMYCLNEYLFTRELKSVKETCRSWQKWANESVVKRADRRELQIENFMDQVFAKTVGACEIDCSISSSGGEATFVSANDHEITLLINDQIQQLKPATRGWDYSFPTSHPNWSTLRQRLSSMVYSSCPFRSLDTAEAAVFQKEYNAYANHGDGYYPQDSNASIAVWRGNIAKYSRETMSSFPYRVCNFGSIFIGNSIYMSRYLATISNLQHPAPRASILLSSVCFGSSNRTHYFATTTGSEDSPILQTISAYSRKTLERIDWTARTPRLHRADWKYSSNISCVDIENHRITSVNDKWVLLKYLDNVSQTFQVKVLDAITGALKTTWSTDLDSGHGINTWLYGDLAFISAKEDIDGGSFLDINHIPRNTGGRIEFSPHKVNSGIIKSTLKIEDVYLTDDRLGAIYHQRDFSPGRSGPYIDSHRYLRYYPLPHSFRSPMHNVAEQAVTTTSTTTTTTTTAATGAASASNTSTS